MHSPLAGKRRALMALLLQLTLCLLESGGHIIGIQI